MWGGTASNQMYGQDPVQVGAECNQSPVVKELSLWREVCAVT